LINVIFILKTMETKKVDRIVGTHYVRIGHSVYNTQPNNEPKMKTICLCCFCGDKFAANASGQCSIYCKSCRKAESRKKLLEENEIIKQANLKLGFNYA